MVTNILHRWNTQRARINRLAKEGGWILVGQIASVLGAFVLVRMLTEYLDPAEYGELALGLTIATLVNQVVMGGIIAGIGRIYSIAAEKGDLGGYLQASWRLLTYATLVVILMAIVLISGLVAVGQSRWMGLAIAVFVFSILSSYNSALNGVQNAARQRPVVALHSGIDAWLKIGLVVGMMLWLGAAGTTVVIGYTLSVLVVTGSQIVFLKRLMHRQSVSHDREEGNENWTLQVWGFGWPFSIWGIFTWSQQASDRWALEAFASTQEVGQYTVLYQLSYTPIIMLTGLLMTFVGPILYQRSGAADDHARNATVHSMAWRISLICLVLTGMAFSCAWLLHEWIFQWLVAEAFRDISHYLPWVLLAGGSFATGQMLSLKLMSEIRTQSLLQMKIGTALIGVGANVLGAWWYGVSGVIAALVIFSVVYMLWSAYIALQ
ncbi:lipopolysaccharide biosynthesis protein [Candidatus Thiosymbion oneisti]|uniref:lipopolysaccharide biosynthesis protein n=1 Tax=Candidatus Thiosymbion oneisti TaxID=589554 RepID=UPI000B7FD5A9|nr:lipopolysaccharide biosynthesis protein [Candidatus Thiosymbion oneisti]